MKYTVKDTQNLIDIFANLVDSNFDKDIIKDELAKLTKYPTNVIAEFLKSVDLIKENDIEDKYMGILGYITMRMNLVDLFNQN